MGLSQIGVAAGGAGPLFLQAVRDTFARSVSNGWGNADVGGLWTPASGFPLADFSTNGTQGVIANVDTTAPFIGLAGNVQDCDLLCRISSWNNPGHTTDQAIGLRWNGTTGWYQAGCWHTDTNGFSLAVKTKPGNVNLSGDINVIASGAGVVPFWVRLQLVGINPTYIRCKAWQDGTQEPANWTWAGSDSTAGLQQAGGTIAIAYTDFTNNVSCMFDHLDVAGLGAAGQPVTPNPPAVGSLYHGRTFG